MEQFGLTQAEAEKVTEKSLRDNGLDGPHRDVVAMSLPEGVIVHIIDTYLHSYADMQNKEYPKRTCNKASIELIENHRKASFGGRSNYPTDLEDYVVYRLDLDIRHEQGQTPEDLGLSEPLVRTMVKIAAEVLSEQIGVAPLNDEPVTVVKCPSCFQSLRVKACKNLKIKCPKCQQIWIQKT